MNELKGKKIAILATDGFEESELFEPKKALEKSGAEVIILSISKGKIRGWNHGDWSKGIKVDKLVNDVSDKSFDALFLPGGVINPDKLRRDDGAVDFIRRFFDSGKLVGAICHGPQLLIEADLVRGKKLTSFSSVKKDLINAGAQWVDQEVVVDNNLVTSRSPEDLEAFSRAFINEMVTVEEPARV